jgi:glycosyltransferase involved in cell wall biosynthesis
MRIAILSLDKGGGCSHCAYELAKAMAGKAEVTCFLAAQNEMLVQFQGLPCRTRLFPMKRGPRSLLMSMLTRHENSGIAEAITSYQPDLVLDAGSGVWGGLVLKQLRGRIPIAQIVHDVFPHPDLRSIIDAVPGWVYGPVADVLIGLSDFSYRQLARKYPHKKCIRIRLGIIMPAGEINLQSVADRRHRQLFFGRIHPYKGVQTLVDAFSIARKLAPRLELTIVGGGPIQASLLRRISQLRIGLDNRYVSDGEIAQILSSHGVMVLPYSSATQSAVAALAIGHGMPCVATNVGGLPEQVIHGRNGLIVPPRDPQALARAMVAISSNAETARRMAEESLRVGQELYSWNTIGQDLLDTLTQFFAVGRSTSPSI